MRKCEDFINKVILPLIPMILWGSLFPMIKIGYKAFSIDSSSVADILMFAALRFTVCGGVLSLLSILKKEKIGKPIGKSIFSILLMGFFSIVLHYAFTYIGLAYSDSSKTALLKQLGTLLYICFAFLFIREEKFSIYKILGAIVGFAGIIAINTVNGKTAFSLGDILIILASVCTVVSSIITRIAVQGSSALWVTGISQLGGGLILLAAATALGGKLPLFTVESTMVFTYICIASLIAYTLWNYLLKKIVLSTMFVIKFAEPLFACIFGAVLLGENILKPQYIVAFVLIASGIFIANRE